MNTDEIGHYVIEETNGFRQMRFQCPDCGVWVDGPVLFWDGEVHLWETWPTGETRELLTLMTTWIKRIAPHSQVPLEKIHVHLEIVNLFAEPDFEYAGFVEYFKEGEAYPKILH